TDTLTRVVSGIKAFAVGSEVNITNVGFVSHYLFRCGRNVGQVVEFDIIFISVHGVQSAGGQQLLVGTDVDGKDEVVVGAVLVVHTVGNNFDSIPLIAGKLPLDDFAVTSTGVDKVVILPRLKCTSAALHVPFQAFGEGMILIAQGGE